MKLKDYKSISTEKYPNSNIENMLGKTIKEVVFGYGSDRKDCLILFTDNTFARLEVNYPPDDGDFGAKIELRNDDRPIADTSTELYQLSEYNEFRRHQVLLDKSEFDSFSKKEQEELKKQRYQEYLLLKKEFEPEE